MDDRNHHRPYPLGSYNMYPSHQGSYNQGPNATSTGGTALVHHVGQEHVVIDCPADLVVDSVRRALCSRSRDGDQVIVTIHYVGRSQSSANQPGVGHGQAHNANSRRERQRSLSPARDRQPDSSGHRSRSPPRPSVAHQSTAPRSSHPSQEATQGRRLEANDYMECAENEVNWHEFD
ncbi:hypothetical protein K4K49_001633 [Colletotrichum sp. SAR 10_70]|nr:hypothetical protein K4K50_003286 [Colletotrichum sp. SAR 10_71]KAI8179736.1 hypothetical protein K4K49_001633 [Colletotrichum sp. SAR 10_70]